MNQSIKNRLNNLYHWMMDQYGPQGWWPLLDINKCDQHGTNPTFTGVLTGYHIKNYTYPKTENQRFEICTGAILTQNTAWTNVEHALLNLYNADILSPEKILTASENKLKKLIQPAGYFNRKTIYLKNMAHFFITLNGKTPSREDILTCKGVGNETADSILLYAYREPEFIIDTYTKRILTHLKLCSANADYLTLKEMFQNSFKPDIVLYQEYHALLVELAKRHFSKKPYTFKIDAIN